MSTDAARTRRELGVLLVLVLGGLACFADKAFTIDDPLNLWLGGQLQGRPFDPFGFSVNWNASLLPLHEISQNPPLTGYWIALAATLFGWSEVALHLAFLVPAAVTTVASYALARRLCAGALEASLVGLLTPVFLLSLTNVMCEAPLLACWCGSIACWLTGFDREHRGWLLAGAALAGLAFVAKFSGAALVPLLFAYGWLRTRRLGAWCALLLVPVATALAYDRATAALYGTGHVVETLRFASEFRVADAGLRPQQVALALAFAGGCLVPAFFYAPLLWSWRGGALGVAAFALGMALWTTAAPGLEIDLSDPGGTVSWVLVAQFVGFAVVGASLPALAIADFWRHRDADSALLALWLLGTLVFAGFFNWVTNARAILPMAPAFGILLLRRLEQRGRPFDARRGVALACSVAVAFWVAVADYRWANDVRRSTQEIAERHVGSGHTTYFLGTWGLQYYLEQAGARPVDGYRFPQRGDRLIVSNNNTDMRSPPESLATLLEVVEGGQPRGLRTVSRGVAGFYASAIGPLPYAWSRGGPDRYSVWRLEHPVRFTPSW